ncbi:unnamed protein product [Phyllotreta striolata]|uniref:PPM-type phosphatase domain-containing protein n=1 Tax=Phyllotreta striolata TaxID=444603 RepID=A0A9N9TEX5_PHYSR|nr:unnamed protein product [Phyllotreta striolata]
MPSLRKRVSSYFRQLSFHNEPRDRRHNINENSFVTKYLQGHIAVKEGPPIIYGKAPYDLPNYELGSYTNGPDTITGCYSGPNGGLTTVKRTEKHLSLLDDDIDFIDTLDDEVVPITLPKKSPIKSNPGQPIDNTTMVIKVAGNEYSVTNRPKRHSKSHSLGSIADFKIEIEKTKINRSLCLNNNNCATVECRNASSDKCDEAQLSKEASKACKDKKDVAQAKKASSRKRENVRQEKDVDDKRNENYSLSKSKSEGNPFHHKKKGKIIKIDRPTTHRGDDATDSASSFPDDNGDKALPTEWNWKSDFVYGLSDSLYDRNQVTKHKNGDPIADCFGIIARKDSAILAVADGVNWGEKASIAAKSAVHGSLHYLNQTIFNDSKPFENLTVKTDESSISNASLLDETTNLVGNTREVFVCLLRAFNCAHDLILENKGMLTTLTVAVVLPLKRKIERSGCSNGDERPETDTRYVCCVCNVGDTLAYVYSTAYGVRELTKGSHDVYSNRDMRDALGALGPVDGINPELSNLTLSMTTLQKGDIVMVASDGLTDNFDPNVCKFTVNNKAEQPAKKPSTRQKAQQPSEERKPVRLVETPAQKPPVKPPRKSKMRDISGRNSAERSSLKSSATEKSSSPSIENVSMHGKTNTPTPSEHSKQLDIPKELSIEQTPSEISSNSTVVNSSNAPVEYDNPLVAAFMRENSLEESNKSNKGKRVKSAPVAENRASSLRRQIASQFRHEASDSSQKQRPVTPKATGSKTLRAPQDKADSPGKIEAGYKFLRSKTAIDMRSSNARHIARNEDGVPFVTPIQRYELQLLLMEDILKNGISGKDSPCTHAKKLCENLISYTMSITSAKRRTLEDPDLYFENKGGVLVEVTNQEKKIRRKRGLEKVQNLPGKLDHVTIVAYNVGNFAYQ